jgi:hypothetical protein
VLRISSPRQIRILRLSGENAVRAQMDIIAPIFFMKNLAVTGHEHRDGVGE